jgi:WD40 repeat protein
MSTSWQTVSVFISSTFNDMHAERDYLVKRVFPELREWCEKRKLRLVDIDLRWGVTEEDTIKHKNVVKVCLDRIDECRPFFICFLGQRRGWVPSKGDVSRETCEIYKDLKGLLGNASVTELEILHAAINPLNDKGRAQYSFFYMREDSYVKDLPKDPPLIKKTYTNASIQDQNEEKLAYKELKIWRDEKIPATGRPVHHYSAIWNDNAITPELRIPLHCPSFNLENQDHWRNLWKMEAGIDVLDLDIEKNPELADRARAFNNSLSRGRLGNFTSDDKPLSTIILDDLKRAIEERFPDHREVPVESDLQKELDQQEQFLHLNNEGFIERAGDFDQLNAYADGDSQNLFVLTAPGGMGKTMLLANWINHYRNKKESENSTLFYRFIGASDRSTTVDSVLRYLLRTMKENAGLFDEEIPSDKIELRKAWPEILAKIGSQKKTVIIVDAVNQLESGLSDLHWVPWQMPPGIKIIISFKKDSDEAEKLYKQFAVSTSVTLAEVKPFTNAEDQNALITAYFRHYLKELDESWIAELISIPGAINPLFLKIVLSELRVFGAFTNLGEKIRNDFGVTPVSAFGAVLNRLENDPVYSPVGPSVAVPLLFGLLSHARVGLSEEELVSIFLQELKCEDNPKTREVLKDTIRLILRQVRPFLAIREGRHDFFYESFRLAAIDRYEGTDWERRSRLSSEWHQLLANYFEHLPPWFSQNENIPTSRRAAQLPYHLAWAGRTDYLTDLILGYELLESIVFDLGSQEAISVISLVLSPPVIPKVPSLKDKDDGIALIQEAIRLSSHVLAKKSNQLPSQLVGRLWRTDNKIVKAFVDSLNRFDRYPWLNPITPSLTRPGSLLRTLIGHSYSVNTVTVLPDNRLAVSGSGDNTLKIWDLESGRELDTLQGHTGSVNVVAIMPDGRRAVSGSNDNTLKVWDLKSGHTLRTLTGHSDWVNAIAITPNGRQVVSGSGDNTLKVWDLESGRELRTLIGHTEGVTAAAVSPDGHLVVSGSKDKTLKVWDLESGRVIHTLGHTDGWVILYDNGEDSEGHTEGVTAVVVSPDGRLVISGSADKNMIVWDLVKGHKLRYFIGHSDSIRTLAVSPDGRLLLSGSNDKTLKVWDLVKGHELRTLVGHTEGVTTVAVTFDNRRVVSGSYDKSLIVWDLIGDREFIALAGHTRRVNTITVTPNGRLAVSGSWDKTLKVWDLESGMELATLKGHNDSVNIVAILPDCRRAVSGSNDKTLKVWDLESGKELSTLKGHENSVNAVALTPDGRQAVSGSWDKTLKVWDLESGRELRTLKGHTGEIEMVVVTPDGKRAVSGSNDQTLKVWDLENGNNIRTFSWYAKEDSIIKILPDGSLSIFRRNNKMRTILGLGLESSRKYELLTGNTQKNYTTALSRDGRLAVSGLKDGDLKVRDKNHKVLHHLTGHTEKVNVVVVMPDGRHAISGSDDQTLKVWDLETGREVHTLAGHTGEIYTIAVTPDGRLAVSGSKDKTLKVWDLESGREVRTLAGHTGAIFLVVLSSDGHLVFSGSKDNTVKIWDLESGLEIRTFSDFTDEVDAMRIIEGDKLEISKRTGIILKVWDIKSGREYRIVHNHDNSDLSAVSPDCRWGITGLFNNTLKIWDLESDREFSIDAVFDHNVTALAFTPDSKRVVSGSIELKVWDVESGHAVRTFKGHTERIRVVTVSPDGLLLISGSDDKTVKIWDLENGSMVADFYCDGEVQVCNYCDLFRSVIVGDTGGRIYILRLEGN